MTVPTLDSLFYTAPSGTQTHLLQTGNPEGPLIICLHGLGGSTETFVPLVPYLPQTSRIVLVDFQGFGKTPLTRTREGISVADHVTDLDHLISHLEASPDQQQTKRTGIVLVGHSLGAIVALHYTSKNSNKVKGLALIGAGRAAGHIPAARERMLNLAASVRSKGLELAAETATKSNFYEDTSERAVDPAAREVVRRAVMASDPEGYARTCEALVDTKHEDPDYGKIEAPCVFIAGDKDMISPVERSQELSALVGSNSRVEVVRSGHQPILEDLTGVKTVLEELIKSISA